MEHKKAKKVKEKVKEAIKDIQEEIQNSIFDWKDDKGVLIKKDGLLKFNDNLVFLINMASETEEGKRLVSLIFNTLNKEIRNKIGRIERNGYEKELKLEYFPIFEDGNYPNLKEVYCPWNRLTNLVIPDAKKVRCSHNSLIDLLLSSAEVVNCSDNQLKNLSLSNAKSVNCSNNPLTKVYFSKAKVVICKGNNNLTSLEVPNGCRVEGLGPQKIKRIKTSKFNPSNFSEPASSSKIPTGGISSKTKKGKKESVKSKRSPVQRREKGIKKKNKKREQTKSNEGCSLM